MKGCFPPHSGPWNPIARNRRISSLKETGLGIGGITTCLSRRFKTGNDVPVTQTYNQPGFQDFAKFISTAFQSLIVRPNTPYLFDFAKIRTVFQKFINRLMELFVNEVTQHTFEI